MQTSIMESLGVISKGHPMSPKLTSSPSAAPNSNMERSPSFFFFFFGDMASFRDRRADDPRKCLVVCDGTVETDPVELAKIFDDSFLLDASCSFSSSLVRPPVVDGRVPHSLFFEICSYLVSLLRLVSFVICLAPCVPRHDDCQPGEKRQDVQLTSCGGSRGALVKGTFLEPTWALL